MITPEELHKYIQEVDQNKMQIDDIHEGLAEVRESVRALHTDHKELKSDISELLSIFKTSKEGIRFLNWIGKAIKWIIGIALAIAGAIAAFKA
jgi:chromosome segregation ATPase